MGAIYKNGIPYGGAPNIEAAAGSHIDESGTPTVTATTSDGTTTFTFDYLKGESSTLPSDNVTGSGTSGQVAVFDGTNSIEGTTLDANDVGAVSTAANQGLSSTEQGNARDNIGLGSAAIKDVPTSGNASTTQVVMGDDTRLSDARQASDVYSWAKAENKPSYTASEVGAIATTAKGANNGVAELDSTGKVPSSQLPSYVDDVLEYSSSSSFPATGETGKIYVDTTTNKTYRWGGSSYVEISASLALGETDATAYRGDHGKTAYDHSQLTSGNPHNVTKSDVGLGNVGNFKAVSTEASQGLTSTEQSNARANIGAGTSNFDGAYSSLSGTPTLGTASAKDVPTSGNASSSQVVMGDDTRLTDSRNAADVYSWAKASTKPDYDADEVDYDNTDSGLTATNVQDAIDEIAENMGGGTATDITYDNTDSGMTATNVQDAVDELYAGKANGAGLTFFIRNGILYVDDGIKPPIVPFSTGTDAEIKAMLDAYYNDEITWQEMGWNIGDTRTISLASMTPPTGSTASTWAAQDITVVIVDHDHTDLATPINGHSKACITVQTRECMNNLTAASTNRAQYGIYVNGDSSYDMSFTKWSNLYMRTYLNSTVWGAFPSTFKAGIKPSSHYRHTTYNGTESEQVTDNLFLPSYPEIFGTASYSDYVVTSPTEGTQFSYYTTSSNRIKHGNNNGASNGTAVYWWEGSASSFYGSSNGYLWCGMNTGGSAYIISGANASGLAPAFAM